MGTVDICHAKILGTWLINLLLHCGGQCVLNLEISETRCRAVFVMLRLLLLFFVFFLNGFLLN